MIRLLNQGIECTDPDNLQFCEKISDKEFWYGEPDNSHDSLLPEVDTPERRIYEKYKGNPRNLLQDAQTDKEVRAFLTNRKLWLTGIIKVDDFTHEEQIELLDDYGYSWDDFSNDAERNQIICENHFEQYPLDYRYDY